MAVRYSVVVPCYNEEANIVDLVQVFDKVHECFNEHVFELVLVDNGSADGTGAAIDACAAERNYVRKVSVEHNLGYGYGITQGMAACEGEFIGWIHADLQFSPLLFIDLFRQTESAGLTGGDRVYYKGLRKNRPAVDTFFTFGMSCFETIYLHQRLWDINAQPTLMTRTLYTEATEPPKGFSLDLYYYYMAVKLGYKIVRFDSVQQVRNAGTSTWNTGMAARLKLIQRNIHDSRIMKRSSQR